MLREARSILINVEARFLEVDTDWFEEIGVDLDMYFNTNRSLWEKQKFIDPNTRLSDFFIPDGVNAGNLKDALIMGSVNDALAPTGTPGINTINTGRSMMTPGGTPTTFPATYTPGMPMWPGRR